MSLTRKLEQALKKSRAERKVGDTIERQEVVTDISYAIKLRVSVFKLDKKFSEKYLCEIELFLPEQNWVIFRNSIRYNTKRELVQEASAQIRKFLGYKDWNRNVKIGKGE